MSYNTQNYSEPGGNTLVIGGELKILEGASVKGLPHTPNISASTATTVADLKSDVNSLIQKLKEAGYIEGDALTITSQVVPTPTETALATNDSKVTSVVFANDVITVTVPVDQLTAFPSSNPTQGTHKWVGLEVGTGLSTIVGLKYNGTALTEDDVTEATSCGCSSGSFVLYIKCDELILADKVFTLEKAGYTVDFLTKKKKMNEGEIPQYYVRDNHEAIIPPETFEMVQTLMATRKQGKNRLSSVSIFSSKIKCGDCGGWYGPKVWHSNSDIYRKVIWQCNHKFEDKKCSTPTFSEDEIKELFLRAANKVIDQKEQFIAIYEQVLSRSLSTAKLEQELTELETEINITAELIEDSINENAHIALDQTEYQKRYAGLIARFDKAKARHAEVTDLIKEKTARKHQIETYLQELRDREALTEFRDTDWLAMVDFITVNSADDILVTFKDGTEIKA